MILLAIALSAAQVPASGPGPSAGPSAGSTADAPITDPARTAPATRIANKLLPAGVFATMMKSSLDMVTNSMTGKMYDVPLKDFVKMAGLNQSEIEKLGPGTVRQMMDIMDPAFEERQRIAMRVMTGEIGTLMTSMEPEYRSGLAESLARRFDAKQLADIDRFFATPSGSAYAGQSMLLFVDPAMMARMQAIMPRLFEAMPAIAQKVTAATAHLPKARDAKSLTPAELEKLKAFFGPAKP